MTKDISNIELKKHLNRFLMITELFFLVVVVLNVLNPKEGVSIELIQKNLSEGVTFTITIVALLIALMAHVYRGWLKDFDFVAK